MLETYTSRIQTVTELTLSIKGVLETGFAFVTVIGEISNLKIPFSGHLYFTLKDQKSQLKAVMFKTQFRYLNMKPQDGIEVVCRGRISVYDARGEYQLLVDSMELKGEGALQIAFENRKKQLAAEGLFDIAHKRPLPLIPERISLITAPTGAAVFDFLKIARQRYPGINIEIFPVRVQGADSADDIATALQMLNDRKGSDVIVLCRGGGSIEDLWPFNEEKVARAIYASTIPVVSAIGHEIDFTIADFVADFRAPTPTAAAQIVVPDRAMLHDRVAGFKQRLAGVLDKQLAATGYQLQILRQKLGDPSSSLAHHLLLLDHTVTALLHATTNKLHREQLRLQAANARLFLHDPRYRLVSQQQRTRELYQKLVLLGRQQFDRKRTRLQKAAILLDAVSPLAVLSRGYSITRTLASGKVIRDSHEVPLGEVIEISLHKGKLVCIITEKQG